MIHEAQKALVMNDDNISLTSLNTRLVEQPTGFSVCSVSEKWFVADVCSYLIHLLICLSS